MAETKKLYTLADILGEPITEQEAQNLIRKETNSDEQTFQNYVNLNETYRNKLLHFIMGKNGLSITYDTVFLQIPLHRITDSASNGSVFPVVTEHFSASSDHAFL